MNSSTNIPGASKNNPSPRVKTPRKKVTPAVAANPADLSAAAMTDPGVTPGVTSDAPLSPARAAIQTAFGLLAEVVAVVEPYLRVVPSGAGKNPHARVSATVAAQIPHMVELFRTRPDVVPSVTLDSIDEAAALAADLHQFAARIATFQGRVGDTDRLTLADAWGGLSPVYTSLKHRARKDKGVSDLIAPLRAGFHRGPRAATTQVVADAAQRQLDAAQKRAARAQHKADLAQQSADLAKQAQTLAAARRNASHATPAPAPAPAPAPTPAPTR